MEEEEEASAPHLLHERQLTFRFEAMANPIFDFSHLSPEERIQLAEDLWDSLAPEALPLTPAQIAELRQRRGAYDPNGPPGQPWDEALDDIERGG